MWLLGLEETVIPFLSIPNKNQVSGCKIFKQLGLFKQLGVGPKFPVSRVKHSSLLPLPIPYEDSSSVIKEIIKSL